MSAERASFGLALLFIASLSWENSVLIQGVGTISALLGVIVAMATAALWVWRGHLLRPPAFLVAFMLFFVWTCASVYWSRQTGAALQYAGTLAQLVVMSGVLLYYGRQRSYQNPMIAAFLIGNVIAAIINLRYFLFQHALGAADSYRLAAPGYNPNGLAIRLALGVPLAWWLFSRANRAGVRWAALAYLPFACLLVTLTASLGGAVVLVIGMVGVLLTVPATLGRRWHRTVFQLTAVAAVGITCLSALKAMPEFTRSVVRLQTLPADLAAGDLHKRERIWAAGWEQFTASPVAGVGAGGFRSAVERTLGSPYAAHNAFVGIGVDTGLVGLGLFLATLLLVFRPLLAVPRPARWILLFTFGSLVAAISTANMELDKTTWYCLTVLLLLGSEARA